ncbi:MAG: filamentous hemagglutinin N-terminal domain-containing protein [Verrucomicrobiota bacterium]
MKTKILPLRRRVLAGAMIFAFTFRALANPAGLTVVSGTAATQATGSQLNINTSQRAFLNWQSFNIAPGERTVFNQPNAYSVVVNQINGQSASQIYGSLQANGIVVLMNSSGFYFGPNSFVSAAGLVVSTANCTPPQNFGGTWEFNGPPPLASIVNYGSIKVGNGGSAFLIADKIENHGSVEAPGGSIGFAAGQTVTLSERPDGRGMSMQVTLPQGSVDNCGNVIADGGTIALNARVVNQNGIIQANSVQNQNGVIELVVADELNLGADSKITANGDASIGGSAGGSITLKSGNTFSDLAGGKISVTGGVNGGNGGHVEISAPHMAAVHSAVDGTARAGSVGGTLLLDPDYIVLDNSGGDSAGSGTVAVGDSPGSTLDLNVGSAFAGFSQITLQANYDILLADGTSWSLFDSTGQSGGQLTLEAGRNIIFGNNTSVYDVNGWSIGLYAGVSDFNLKTVAPGAGSIYLNGYDPNNSGNGFNPGSPGNGFIKTASGDITLVAGQDITVGTGCVNTTGGGSIYAHALAGNIDTGGFAQGYFFQSGSSASEGYYVDPSGGVSGISTMAGGDVNLTAGGDINSLRPGKGGYYYDGTFYSLPGNANLFTAGSGAYGVGSTEAGNVTIIAGGNVTGNYLVGNGVGNIFAGVTMDAGGNPVKDGLGNYVLGGSGSAGTSDTSPNLALNLVSGGWNVTAAQNIMLQEVRNPNGVFNSEDRRSGSYHAFDYAPSDYVNLTAGNLVELIANSSSLPRTGELQVPVPVIYPGILNIVAGAGGVVLNGDNTYNQLILYPSPLGGLTITTTDGGSLIGSIPANNDIPQIFKLIVSDSGNSRYYKASGDLFGLDDHAATPVHLNSERPIALNISGDMNYLLLGAPEAAQLNVVGNMNNCRFQGMNLNDADVTSITVGQAAKINMENKGLLNPATDGGLTVGGDIYNRGAFTSIDLNSIPGAQAPDLSVLSRAYGNAISTASLMTGFFYNPATKILTYQNISGTSLASALSLLQHLTVQDYQNGVPQWADPPFNTVPKTTTVSVLDSATAQALLARYDSLGLIPGAGGGFTLGGGGKFEITARNLDLGTTSGIQAAGAGFYSVAGDYLLRNYFTRGADIDINLTGELDMFSSSIASLQGGRISIAAGGAVNTGSSEFNVISQVARGIYSTSGGDVSIIAGGNVNVNGSRIAAYDGGNVTVESRNGNVDAGTGASLPVNVQGYYVDPVTHKFYQTSPGIPFSGILAMTFPPRDHIRYPAPPAILGNILVEAPNGNVTANLSGILQIALNNLNYPDALVTVLAGYELRDGVGNPVTAGTMTGATPVFVSDARDINAAGSGIIASNAKLDATGDINGLIFARNNIDIVAQQNVNVTALGEGTVSVGAGGSISGTVIGVGGVSASGGSVEASLVSGSVSGSTSGQSGLGAGGAANATASAASASDDSSKVAKKPEAAGEDDVAKKKTKGITLAQKVSRVTVLLPSKN